MLSCNLWKIGGDLINFLLKKNLLISVLVLNVAGYFPILYAVEFWMLTCCVAYYKTYVGSSYPSITNFFYTYLKFHIMMCCQSYMLYCSHIHQCFLSVHLSAQRLRVPLSSCCLCLETESKVPQYIMLACVSFASFVTWIKEIFFFSSDSKSIRYNLCLDAQFVLNGFSMSSRGNFVLNLLKFSKRWQIK